MTTSEDYAKPKRTHGENLFIWFYHHWKHVPAENRIAVRAYLLTAALVFLGLGVLEIISVLLVAKLVELPTVISFGLVELFAFFLAKYFLAERAERRSIMELMAVVDNLPKYSHLIVHFVNVGYKYEDYPERPEYVLNTGSNWAFYVPTFVRELSNVGAIQRVEHDTEDELYSWFKNHHVHLVRGYPQAHDLESTFRPNQLTETKNTPKESPEQSQESSQASASSAPSQEQSQAPP